MEDLFEDIRPYNDDEIAPAMKRIAGARGFSLVAQYLFPNVDSRKMKETLLSIDNCNDFQWKFMAPAVAAIEEKSTEGVTFEGYDFLDKEKRYLFLSNHRDIVLDATFLTYHLAMTGFRTPEISFGANLMHGELVVDFGKSNKMFKVERPSTSASPREFFMFSKRLSSYIRHTITDKGESVWIAQRNGRTKDGDDQTDLGIIKMFEMSSPLDKIDSLSELNIVPVSISYEWEPCDILKVLELYEARSREYVKKPGEDLTSILTGIVQRKGRVSLRIGKPLERADMLPYSSLTVNRFNKEIAELLDRRIFEQYRLWPNNYIAHDIRFGQNRFESLYSKEQKDAFLAHMARLSKFDYPQDALQDIFLGIYSNPVDNVLGK